MKRTHSQSVIKENVNSNVPAIPKGVALKPRALYVIPQRRPEVFFQPKLSARELLNFAVNQHNHGQFDLAMEYANKSLEMERSAKGEMLLKLCEKALAPKQNRVSFTE